MAKKKPANHDKHWEQWEEDYLTERFGDDSIDSIAKKVQRKPLAVWQHAVQQMKLGGARENSSYMMATEVARQLKITKGTMYRWIERFGFPVRTKVISLKQKNHLVPLDKMWDWLKDNPHMWKAIKLQDMGLGVEPEWVRTKRLQEMETPNDGKRWTPKEKEEAFCMRQRGMTWEEVATAIGRKPKGVQTAIERYVHVKMGRVVTYGQASSRKKTFDTAEDSTENEGVSVGRLQHSGVGELIPHIGTHSETVFEGT